MGVRLASAVVQIFARDVHRSIEFYRQLGLPVPEPGGPDPHVDVELPGGNRLSFDAEQTITDMHPDWTPSDRAGRSRLPSGLTRPPRSTRRSNGRPRRAIRVHWSPMTRRGVSAMPPSSTRTATWWTYSHCLPVESAPSRSTSGDLSGLEHEAGAPVRAGSTIFRPQWSPALCLAHAGTSRRASQRLAGDPFACSCLRGESR